MLSRWAEIQGWLKWNRIIDDYREKITLFTLELIFRAADHAMSARRAVTIEWEMEMSKLRLVSVEIHSSHRRVETETMLKYREWISISISFIQLFRERKILNRWIFLVKRAQHCHGLTDNENSFWVFRWTRCVPWSNLKRFSERKQFNFPITSSPYSLVNFPPPNHNCLLNIDIKN